jgi:hypothetical protein
MPKLLKNLLSLWMVLAIALPPLQAFGALSAPVDAEPCAMQSTASAHEYTGAQASQHGDMQTRCFDCQQCDQQGCDGDTCSTGGCSGMQVQPALLPTQPAVLFRAAVSAERVPVTGIRSRTDPPPLPPPV